MHRPSRTSKEVTLSRDKEVPSDDAAHCTQDGIKSGNKRCNQRPLGTTTMTNRDDDRGWEARSPMDHIKRLL
jgi:hypothetical protein